MQQIVKIRYLKSNAFAIFYKRCFKQNVYTIKRAISIHYD
jgi:hypothetical protein